MEVIQDCCMSAHILLKNGHYKENHYQRCLTHYLQEAGMNVSMEVVCHYQFGKVYVGFGRMDIVALHKGKRYILELKVNGHNKVSEHMQQLRKYMRHSPCDAGFVIIFSSSLLPKIYKETNGT